MEFLISPLTCVVALTLLSCERVMRCTLSGKPRCCFRFHFWNARQVFCCRFRLTGHSPVWCCRVVVDQLITNAVEPLLLPGSNCWISRRLWRRPFLGLRRWRRQGGRLRRLGVVRISSCSSRRHFVATDVSSDFCRVINVGTSQQWRHSYLSTVYKLQGREVTKYNFGYNTSLLSRVLFDITHYAM